MKTITIDEISVPTFMYGTAWKEEKTQQLVEQAIAAGFRSIDTANQRRHYYEAAVGDALEVVFKEELSRSDIFLQTKFTYVRGQDHRLPYDPEENYTTQVQQSFASSLEHLKTDYVDSYVLHGPSNHISLTDIDWEVWTAMTQFYKAGKTKLLGVSNINYEQLEALLQNAEVKPRFVQNRCFAHSQWDKKIRDLCTANSIYYQGFSLLTANVRELNNSKIEKITEKYNCTVPQMVFRFALQVGMLPMTGTTDAAHMREDLQMYELELSKEEITTIENIA